jgi:hypothetical protein
MTSRSARREKLSVPSPHLGYLSPVPSLTHGCDDLDSARNVHQTGNSVVGSKKEECLCKIDCAHDEDLRTSLKG